MTGLAELAARGGPALWAIAAVGLAVYGGLAHGLIELVARPVDRARTAAHNLDRLPLIRAGIAAAPLLGLLGTVSGLVQSFEGLLGDGRTDALAHGIGRAMLTTEYGLIVAAPAMVLAGLLERAARARIGQPGGRR